MMVTSHPVTEEKIMGISIRSKLVEGVDEHAANLPGSWYITHPLGGPAAGTYTEVAFSPEAIGALNSSADVLAHTEDAVRMVASSLYGDRWAFAYMPHAFDDSIGRYGARRRERVLVSEVSTW